MPSGRVDVLLRGSGATAAQPATIFLAVNVRDPAPSTGTRITANPVVAYTTIPIPNVLPPGTPYPSVTRFPSTTLFPQG